MAFVDAADLVKKVRERCAPPIPGRPVHPDHVSKVKKTDYGAKQIQKWSEESQTTWRAFARSLRVDESVLHSVAQLAVREV